MVARKYKEMSSQLIDVDAKLAKELLEANRSNRPFSQGLSDRYADLMYTGKWCRELPFIIYIDWNGDLHNSQHTLRALLAADEEVSKFPDWYLENFGLPNPLTLKAVMITGIDPEAANFIDTGKTRSHGDIVFRLSLFETDAKGQANDYSPAVLKTMATWMATAAKVFTFHTVYGLKPRASKRFEHREMLSVLTAHPGLQQSTEFVYKTNKKTLSGITQVIPAPYAVALHYMAWHSVLGADGVAGKRRGFADALIEAIAATPPGGEKGQPFFELHDWLAKKAKTADNSSLNQRFDGCILAFHAHSNKQTVTSKELTAKEDQFPQFGGLDSWIKPVEEAPAVVDPAEVERLAREAAEKKIAEEKAKAEEALKASKARQPAAAAPTGTPGAPVKKGGVKRLAPTAAPAA